MSEEKQSEYSVLMPVYAGEKPCNLRQAIDSILRQSVATDDFVIVCDGALTRELDAVLESAVREHPGLFQILRLPRSLGAGDARAAGVLRCKHERIAIMDSDDIALPDRVGMQLELMEQDPAVGVVGGQIREFLDGSGRFVGIRQVPLTHREILRRARGRMPVNHVTVMFKKSDILAAGNYLGRGERGFEDYDLCVRLLMRGVVFRNLPQVLVEVRVNQNTYRRRGGGDYFRFAKKQEDRLLQWGFITRGRYCLNLSERFLAALLPNWLRGCLFRRLMRVRKLRPEKNSWNSNNERREYERLYTQSKLS